MKTTNRNYIETTYVYEAFDAFGNLLYVGITNDLKRRLSEHRRSAKWWSQQTEIKHTVHASRDDAKEHETQLIEFACPVFNIAETDKQAEVARLSWQKRKERQKQRREPRFIVSPRETVALLSIQQIDEIDELIELLTAIKTFRRTARYSLELNFTDTLLTFARILCDRYGVVSERWAASND